MGLRIHRLRRRTGSGTGQDDPLSPAPEDDLTVLFQTLAQEISHASSQQTTTFLHPESASVHSTSIASVMLPITTSPSSSDASSMGKKGLKIFGKPPQDHAPSSMMFSNVGDVNLSLDAPPKLTI
jgi:hypothetical protein